MYYDTKGGGCDRGLRAEVGAKVGAKVGSKVGSKID